MRVLLIRMRWDTPSLVDVFPSRPRIERHAVRRSLGATTFYEVQARSIVETVPQGTGLPYRWGVSPYRGCASACLYCPGRRGHRRMGLDDGPGYGTAIVARTNAARRLRAELARPSWAGEPVAVGVGGDCYQRAEEVYRLMPQVVAALRDAGNPFTVLTKSPLVLRDAELLAEAGQYADARAMVSVGFVDDRLRRMVEPGAVSPQKRLEVCAALNEARVPCGVLLAPVLPCLTDSSDQLRAAVRRAAEAGAVEVTPVVLALPPGAREWYLQWLSAEHPGLLPRYAELYRSGPLASAAYRERITAEVAEFAALYGVGRSARRWRRRRSPARQLALL
jgi:DNA repair photolyase